jgi:hypothetical protein
MPEIKNRQTIVVHWTLAILNSINTQLSFTFIPDDVIVKYATYAKPVLIRDPAVLDIPTDNVTLFIKSDVMAESLDNILCVVSQRQSNLNSIFKFNKTKLNSMVKFEANIYNNNVLAPATVDDVALGTDAPIIIVLEFVEYEKPIENRKLNNIY